MSYQGFMNGGQARDAFLAYNVHAGSEVVDMSRNYNTGDKYSNQISNGNQLDLAFAEINADKALTLFNPNPDWTDGQQLKLAFAKLHILSSQIAPIWAIIDDLVMATTDAFPITDLDTVCLSSGGLITFSVSSGALPTGITLNPDGTFLGTATEDTESGSVVFSATDDNGTTTSGTINWIVT